MLPACIHPLRVLKGKRAILVLIDRSGKCETATATDEWERLHNGPKTLSGQVAVHA